MAASLASRRAARAAGQAASSSFTSVVAAGANPTKAEYDALRADVAALRTALKNAGLMA
jgi:hypothetical protein